MSDYPSWVSDEIIAGYVEYSGIHCLLPWQQEVLSNPALRAPSYTNLVFSAPTSSGKSIVAELITVNTVLELHCKALFVFPYVSVAKEKFFSLQKIWRRVDLQVSAYIGTHSSPPQAWDGAVCTIEKANSLLNRLITDKNTLDIGVIVIDEFHMLFDENRGSLVEQIVGKALYISHFLRHQIQVICLSATLPLLDELIHWLGAVKYETQFRPVELLELILCGTELRHADTLEFVRTLPTEFVVPNDNGNIIQLCVESIVNHESVLIFCSSKAETEKIALAISNYFEQCITSNTNERLISSLDIQTLKCCEDVFRNELQFVDDILLKTVPYGVAFHHAGLTVEEREVIECAFREHSLRIICATSTLSSGVNLPAHRVIIKAQISGPVGLNGLTYMQMVGRAGRLGQTIKGESIIICTKKQLDSVRRLIHQKATFASRCVVKRRRLKLIIEAICSGLCNNENCLQNLLSLMFFESDTSLNTELTFLVKKKLISYRKGYPDGELQGTQLGRAVFASSLPPEVALQVYSDLEKAIRSLALDTELHLLYLVTPLHNDTIWMNYIDWNVYYKIWSKLPVVLQRVGKLVGVRDSFILGKMQGRQATDPSDMQIHLRFLSALALFDLIRECPLRDVARRFQISRGALQTLQQQSATYAHMVVVFCDQLGWEYLRSVLDGFSERLAFGVRKDLTELVQIEGIDGARARAFHNANVTTIAALATTCVDDIAKILRSAVPFIRRRNSEGLNRWLANESLMTDVQAAQELIQRARFHISSSLRNMGISTDAKIDLLFSAVNLPPEIIRKEENSNTENSKCNLSADIFQSDAFEPNSSNIFTHQTLPVDFESLLEESIESIQNENSLTGEPTRNSLSADFELSKTQPSEINLSNYAASDKPALKQDYTVDKGNLNELNSHNTEQLCQNLSTTSISDETLLRLGCTQFFVIQHHITQVLDAASILIGNEKFAKEEQKKPLESIESEATKLLEILSSAVNEASSTTTTAVAINGAHEANFLDKMQKSENVKDVSDFESNDLFRICPDKTLSSPRSNSLQQRILEDIEEEEGNVEVLDENSATYSLFNTSNDLFDRTCCSSASSHSLHTPQNPSSCMDRVRRRSSNNRSIISPSFQSPLHKMLKPGSPLLGSLKQEKSELSVGSKYDEDFELRSPRTTEFQITDICGSRRSWEQFLIDSKYWNEIGIGIATCNNNVVGIALCALGEKCAYIDLRQESICPVGIYERVAILNTLLKSQQQKFIYDLLSAMRLLRKLPGVGNSITELKNCICLQTLSYLAHYRTPDGESAISFQELISQLTSSERAAVTRSATPRIRAAIHAFVSLHVHDDLTSAAIRLSSIQSVDLELKSVVLFSQIEAVGIPFDTNQANTIVEEIKQALTKIEAKTYRMAGATFNLSSAAEISQVLFVRLQIPPPNESTGRHYSTNKTVLKQLASAYPIANLILEWRRMSTALTTSLPALLKSCCPDGRIRANFVTHCCTGRVLTVHPNVQNVQKEAVIDGYSVRSLFVAPKDYCQLEMRILAHLSADRKLLSMFNQTDGDFFQTVVNTWNSMESLSVKVDRDKAKKLCYGILYGMGAASLGKQLGLQKQQAQQLISSFFEHFPKVRTWMNGILDICRTEGTVFTMLGRRRFLPRIRSMLQIESTQAERQAINTCIQGSAAELFKMALLQLQNNLSNTNSSIIMQLHDEVLVETDENLLTSVVEIVKHSLTTVFPDFRVPLAVKILVGKNWGDLHEYTENLASANMVFGTTQSKKSSFQ